MSEYLDAIGVYALLRRECAAAGGPPKWADANRISRGFLNNVLNGHREPSDAMLSALGLRKAVQYAVVRDRETINEKEDSTAPQRAKACDTGNAASP